MRGNEHDSIIMDFMKVGQMLIQLTYRNHTL